MENLSKSNGAYPGFTDKGFQIYNLNYDINESEMVALNIMAKTLKTTPIFNEQINSNDETIKSMNDEKRRSSEPIKFKTNRVVKKLINAIEQIVELDDPENCVQKCVVLESSKDCAKQAQHTDGTPNKTNFCSCIFAIEDGTKINMNGVEINLPKGEAIIFHPNVPHHGCSYEIENRRFFFYIAKNKNDIPDNAVGNQSPVYCEFCKELLYYEYTLSKKQLNNKKSYHRSICEEQNKPEDINKFRAKRIQTTQGLRHRAAAKVAKESETEKAETSEQHQEETI